MDRNQGPGRKRRRRRSQDQPGGGPRELRRGGGETVGGAPDWHQRSRTCVWRATPSDLVVNEYWSRETDAYYAMVVTMRRSASPPCVRTVSHSPRNPGATQ